ncbi:MAG: hypothetical protein L0Z53_25095 [Acidobacteriales bacterium]|nr:hypothetical protein [Terriglobales bacterium]
MNQSSSNRKLIAGLALAGFASGILSVIFLEIFAGNPQLNEFRSALYVPGVVFGVVISACYAIFFRFRSWARLLSLVAAATAAYFFALQCSVYALVGFKELDWAARPWAFYGALFIGGVAGAFVLLTAAQLLLATRRKWKAVLAAALLWSLAGGLLGVAGFALGSSVGKLLWLALSAVRLPLSDASLEAAVSDQNVNMFSMFVLWQTCMAPVLGWLVAKSSAGQPQHQSAISA